MATPSLAFTRENITPTKAKRLIDQTRASGFRQRPVSQAVVKKYAHSIATGLWQPDTGDTIKLALRDDVEIVLDAQHRLEAVIASNQAQTFWIVRYVEETMFRYFDQGQPRDLSDMLAICDWPEPKVLSSAGRMLWKEDTTGSPFIKPDADEMLTDGEISEHLEINYRVPLVAYFNAHNNALRMAQSKRRGAKAWMLYLFFRLSKVDAAKADDALAYLADSALPLPHTSWVRAMEYVDKVRESFEREGGGRILKGRNVDQMEETVRAYRAAWEVSLRGARRGLTLPALKREMARMAGRAWDTLA